MSGAETLSRAAEAIRNDWRDEEEGREFMFAVADWLDAQAANAEALDYSGSGQPGSCHAAALAVANAYLQETPCPPTPPSTPSCPAPRSAP